MLLGVEAAVFDATGRGQVEVVDGFLDRGDAGAEIGAFETGGN